MHRPTMSSSFLAATAASLLVLAGCGGDGDAGSAADTATSADTAAATATPDTACRRLTSVSSDSMETTSSGLGILRVTEGQGAAAAAGDTVAAHYLGCLTDGTRLDASYQRGEPITFVLGRGNVIQGWDEGLVGMRPGGVRHLRIPPELGYGARGTPGGPIPPNSTLLFEVRMVEVRPAGDGTSGG